MRTLRSLLMLSFAIAVLAAAANRAPAAESYDSCVGDINTVPTVIATGGTWCLRHNVITTATNIRAVDIRTNNVTIDCNGFRLADAQAGPSTLSIGISANGPYSNITVRNCTIIGFNFGIFLSGNPGGGYVIENNLLSFNRSAGIRLDGAASIVRHNTVANTGGQPGSVNGIGIVVNGSVDVIDNVVDGIAGDGSVAFNPVRHHGRR